MRTKSDSGRLIVKVLMLLLITVVASISVAPDTYSSDAGERAEQEGALLLGTTIVAVSRDNNISDAQKQNIQRCIICIGHTSNVQLFYINRLAGDSYQKQFELLMSEKEEVVRPYLLIRLLKAYDAKISNDPAENAATGYLLGLEALLDCVDGL